jgi:hypothetical protein
VRGVGFAAPPPNSDDRKRAGTVPAVPQQPVPPVVLLLSGTTPPAPAPAPAPSSSAGTTAAAAAELLQALQTTRELVLIGPLLMLDGRGRLVLTSPSIADTRAYGCTATKRPAAGQWGEATPDLWGGGGG